MPIRQGSIRHILILWGPATELYALDTEKKILYLSAYVDSVMMKLLKASRSHCEQMFGG